MPTVYLGLGSNIDNRDLILLRARILININLGVITKTSKLYLTAPWGFEQQEDFTNQVIELQTLLPLSTFHGHLLAVEDHLKKFKTSKYGPRNIDIDILLYDDQIINTEDLNIPHPRMHERNFVLIPLAEIAPSLQHPLYLLTMEELSIRCNDKGSVRPQD